MDNCAKSVAVISHLERGQDGRCHKPDVNNAAKELNRPARKPKWATLSYIAAISQAILASPTKRLPLAEIYQFIEQNHPEFKEGRPRWKNTVRHNLSLHECFVKGEMTANQKCCFWKIHPRYLARFSRGDFSRRPADVDVNYRDHLVGASCVPSARSEVRDAVSFYNWIPSYPRAAPLRTPDEWYQPFHSFLQHPTAMGLYPPSIRGNPRHSMLYLSGVWDKNRRSAFDAASW